MNSYDSGKTILSRMLAETFVKQGHRVEYLKPISGHNYWYRNEHTQRCIEDSLLVSWDATIVRKELSSKIPIELANPIHSLFVPAVLENPEETLSSTLAIGGWDSILSLQRYTNPTDNLDHLDVSLCLTVDILCNLKYRINCNLGKVVLRAHD